MLGLRKIADEVARGVFKELDYHNEAYNAELFLKKHRFLPFITAPEWLPEFTGPKGTARVLYLACERSRSKALLDPFGFESSDFNVAWARSLRTLEWIHGRKLQEIESEEERMRMVDPWKTERVVHSFCLLLFVQSVDYCMFLYIHSVTFCISGYGCGGLTNQT